MAAFPAIANHVLPAEVHPAARVWFSSHCFAAESPLRVQISCFDTLRAREWCPFAPGTARALALELQHSRSPGPRLVPYDVLC